MGRKKRNAKKQSTASARLPTKNQIGKLPIRGIVYYAWRCATRVENLIGGFSSNHVECLAEARISLLHARRDAGSFLDDGGNFSTAAMRYLMKEACNAVASIEHHERAARSQKSAMVNAAKASKELAVAAAYAYRFSTAKGQQREKSREEVVAAALKAARYASLAAARNKRDIRGKLSDDFEKARRAWPANRDDDVGRAVEFAKLPPLNDACKPFPSNKKAAE